MSIVFFQLATQQDACSLPPDKVAGSPIPALQKPVSQAFAFEANSWSNEVRILKYQPLPAERPARSKRAQDRSPLKSTSYDEVQPSVWDSPEMQEAREFLKEFCRRAAQTSPAEGEKFLAQLALLSPEELQNWLDRFQSRQSGVARGQEVDALTRRIRVGQSLSRIEANRRSAENVAELRRRATVVRRFYGNSPTLEQLPSLGVEGLTERFGFTYDPMEAVVDPSSPRGVARHVAASWSLPGDLPRSDPRNFIRGEEGVDFGEWATTKNAVPPNLAAPPGPAAPPAPAIRGLPAPAAPTD